MQSLKVPNVYRLHFLRELMLFLVSSCLTNNTKQFFVRLAFNEKFNWYFQCFSIYALNSLLKPSVLKVTEALVCPREKVLIKLRAKNYRLCRIKKNALLFYSFLVYASFAYLPFQRGKWWEWWFWSLNCIIVPFVQVEPGFVLFILKRIQLRWYSSIIA